MCRVRATSLVCRCVCQLEPASLSACVGIVTANHEIDRENNLHNESHGHCHACLPGHVQRASFLAVGARNHWESYSSTRQENLLTFLIPQTEWSCSVTETLSRVFDRVIREVRSQNTSNPPDPSQTHSRMINRHSFRFKRVPLALPATGESKVTAHNSLG